MSPNDALGRYPLGTTLKIHPHTPPMPFGREYEVKIGQLQGQPPSWYLCGSDSIELALNFPPMDIEPFDPSEDTARVLTTTDNKSSHTFKDVNDRE